MSGCFRYPVTVTDSDVPPLPELTIKPRAAKPEEQNDWLRLVEAVPVYAEGAPFIRSINGVTTPTRSPFRTGKIMFDRDGIMIEGMVVKPMPPWVTYLSLFAVFPQLLIQMTTTLGKRMGIPVPVRIGLFILWIGLAFVPVMLRSRFDRIRVSATTCLGWESLQAIQVDPQLRFLTLVFQPFAVPRAKDKVRPRELLTLKKLDPATIAGVVTTIEQYAPNVLREEPTTDQNIRWRWVIIVVLSFLGVALGLMLFLSYLRRHNIP